MLFSARETQPSPLPGSLHPETHPWLSPCHLPTAETITGRAVLAGPLWPPGRQSLSYAQQVPQEPGCHSAQGRGAMEE